MSNDACSKQLTSYLIISHFKGLHSVNGHYELKYKRVHKELKLLKSAHY